MTAAYEERLQRILATLTQMPVPIRRSDSLFTDAEWGHILAKINAGWSKRAVYRWLKGHDLMPYKSENSFANALRWTIRKWGDDGNSSR